MEVKIGIAESPRELVLSSNQTADEVEKLVSDALESGKTVVSLVDDKGRKVLIPAGRIAYVEIAAEEARSFGFNVG